MKIFTLYPLILLRTAQLVSAQKCGPNIGSCAAGECCSQWGYCGSTPEHCGSALPPPSSGGSTPPPSNGGSTRPQFGNVPYGTIIDRCTTPGKIALTYDDGPSEWTPQLLDILSSLNVKATFFITGLGSRASITDPIWANVIRRTYNEGHQIGNHGWAHLSLPSLSYDAQRSEITTNENALQGILGFIPTYYRCPYLDCNSASGLPILNELGYHVISVNADTKDYLYDSPDQIYNAMDAFSNQVSWNPGQDSYINLAHDIRYQTVVSLTKFMIETARARGYQLVTVGECLGDSRENWYRGGGSVARSTPPTTRNPGPALQKVISPNGLCAGSDGHTCQESKFGDCCSEWGYCGATEDFCAGGCNSAFGTCA